MGKVFKNVLVGYAGAISRSVDDVVASFANTSNRSIPFGWPVFLDADGVGVVPINEDMTTANDAGRFVGIAVRSPSKTPDVYYDPANVAANSTACYEKGEIVDVLTRGTVVVDATGSNPKPGMPVYFDKTYGSASAMNPDSKIVVPGVFFRSTRDGAGRAEIVITERHLQ